MVRCDPHLPSFVDLADKYRSGQDTIRLLGTLGIHPRLPYRMVEEELDAWGQLALSFPPVDRSGRGNIPVNEVLKAEDAKCVLL